MKKIAVFDLETDPFKAGRSPVPFLAGFFDGERTRIFKGKNCVAECYALMRKFGGYIYAHNGGKFDFRYLLPHLTKDKAELFAINGRAASFRLENGTEFLDSFCVLPVALKATGGKKDIDYRKLERDVRDEHMSEIIEYLKQDLYVLHEKVTEFVGEYGFGITLAGRTFAQFKEKFGIHPPKTNEFFDRRFRDYYYGGRVEFFELGPIKGTFKLIDINSAYPHAMTRGHAFGLEFETRDSLPGDRQTLETSFVRFIGRARGLPFRGEDKSLSFGEHAGEFFATGWELANAIDFGDVEIDAVISCLIPTETRNFSEFVHHFYGMKKKAEKGSSDELFAKFFLNSSYGRFALNPREFVDVKMTAYREEPEENIVWRKKVCAFVKMKHPELRGKKFREMAAAYWDKFADKWTIANDFEDDGITIWEKPVEIKSNSFFNVATAASITGCVRANLARALRSVKRPVYCDTDSIICSDTGKLRLGTDLGEWKLEAVSKKDGLHIAGKKLYAMEIADDPKGKKWKFASKGVRLKPEQIVRVAKGEKIVSKLDAPTFSIFTSQSVAGSERDFVERTTVRDDFRKRRSRK